MYDAHFPHSNTQLAFQPLRENSLNVLIIKKDLSIFIVGRSYHKIRSHVKTQSNIILFRLSVYVVHNSNQTSYEASVSIVILPSLPSADDPFFGIGVGAVVEHFAHEIYLSYVCVCVDCVMLPS